MTFRFPTVPRWSFGPGLALGLGLTSLLPAIGFQGPPPPPPPDRLFHTLDRDHDGMLSPDEIRDSAEALKDLDDDQDGTLSRDELFPPRPPRGGRGPEGPPPRDFDEDEGPPDAQVAITRTPDGAEKIPLSFRGGHETDPRDHGRPVALVAGALGVAPEVFRDAFSKVKPAPAGTDPTPERARRNKEVLLAALGPLGITNEQIDRASNQYRYARGRGEMWPVKAAAGHAIVKDGVLTSVVVTEPGNGYNSAPTVSIPGHPELALDAKIQFSRDLKANGSVSSVTPVKGDAKPR